MMVNLFRLKDESQFDAFVQDTMRIGADTVKSAGVETLYAGAVAAEFVAGAGDHWHRMTLVRYPGIEALRSAFANDELYEEVSEVRRAYLDDARFILTTPLGG